MEPGKARELLLAQPERPHPNWWILGGSAVFVAFTLGMGFSQFAWSQEIIFAGSFAIIAFLIAKLTRELEPDALATLIGTVAVVFVYRTVPGAGDGLLWWEIDVLGFDEQFLAVLELIAGVLTLFGMFLFRRFMAVRSIAYVVGFLTIVGAILSLPILGLYHGLHEWTMAMTGGIVDARNIVIVNVALASPLGQIAMIPMLAWIANSAPANLKATYFAVMASYTNLALSAGQIGTKYINQCYCVKREVKAPATGAIKVAADYSQLGDLLVVGLIIGLVVPFVAIVVVRALGLKWA